MNAGSRGRIGGSGSRHLDARLLEGSGKNFGIVGEILQQVERISQTQDGNALVGVVLGAQILEQLIVGVGLIQEWSIQSVEQDDGKRTGRGVVLRAIGENVLGQRRRLRCLFRGYLLE